MSLRVLTSETGGWQDLDGDIEDRFTAFLTQVLTSRHLAVLSGLGTSRCITDDKGQSLAPTMSDLWNAVKKANKDRFDEVLAKISWDSASENVELLLSHCQMQQELTPNDVLKTFIEKGEKAIASSCDFVDKTVDLAVHEAFLRKVARRSTKLPRTQIFTTNYDLAFEAAAAKIGFAVIDGFATSIPARFDPIVYERDYARRDTDGSNEPIDWVPNVAQLHKLHGSIDWSDAAGSVERVGPTERPVIIYPRSSKFEVSYQQPFLELMARFQSSLRRSGTGLIVAGSGFEDRHITEPLMAAVRGNVGINIVVIARSIEAKTTGIVGDLRKLIEAGDRRIALVAGSFEDAVPKLPDLVARMEEELHTKRLEALADA